MLINLFDTEMATQKEINEELSKKFVSKEKFAEEIESLVLRTQMNYIDAIVEYCEINNIEVDTIGKMISKPLKEKIKYDATELNFLKRTTRAKLPL
jgi:hypothetical protein